MTRNRLADATSPYLRQHADNPVHWWPWSPEALAAARAGEQPIHLSIGYAACHWCHVMAAESFCDPGTAEYLNANFVNIKVDREERPDIDQIYMKALQALGEHGGWPMTMFLAPDGEPFFGGTYFPPSPKWGRPSFQQVLHAVRAAWDAKDAAIDANRAALVRALSAPAVAGGPTTEDTPEEPLTIPAAAPILKHWDFEHGGFRGAPKFPNAPILDLLWRAGLRSGSTDFHHAVLTTLRALCQGGIYDHLAGGLARYAVDQTWTVPHFEKMLSDNAQLLDLLDHAYRATGERLFRARIAETIGWLKRTMRLPGAGFAASLDADTEHEEGATYVWSAAELQDILGADYDRFAALYGVTAEGNFEGRSVLTRLHPGGRDWLGDDAEGALADLRARVLALRDLRPQPARDDKVLADWNAATVHALARAARTFGNDQWLADAIAVFGFIATDMAEDDRLYHSWFDGTPTVPGLATDYAQMIRAALTLNEVTGEPRYLERAIVWFAAARRDFFDADAGTYFLSPRAATDLFVRPESVVDDAMPAATGLMVEAAARLLAITGDPAYAEHARTIRRAFAARADLPPAAVPGLIAGFDTLDYSRTVHLQGGNPADPLARSALKEPDPALRVVLSDDHTNPPVTVPADSWREPETGPRAFLCGPFGCLLPIDDPTVLAGALSTTRAGAPPPVTPGNPPDDLQSGGFR